MYMLYAYMNTVNKSKNVYQACRFDIGNWNELHMYKENFKQYRKRRQTLLEISVLKS